MLICEPEHLNLAYIFMLTFIFNLFYLPIYFPKGPNHLFFIKEVVFKLQVPDPLNVPQILKSIILQIKSSWGNIAMLNKIF